MNKPWSKDGKVLQQVPVHTKHGMTTAGRWKTVGPEPEVKFFPRAAKPGEKLRPLSRKQVIASYAKLKDKHESLSEYMHKYYAPYTSGTSTQKMYAGDRAREELRDQIVSEVVNRANTPPAGTKPIAVLMGGGAASGKSYVREKVIDPALQAGGVRVGVCDPDDMKTRLPEWDHFVKNDPQNAASILHQESVKLADQAFYKLMEEGKNILYDKTMRVVGDYRKKIQELHDHGYNVVVVGVTTDINTALKRAEKRERKIPEATLRATHSGFATAWEFIKDYADDYRLYDSTSGDLELIESIHGVEDKSKMEEFHDRGKNGQRRRAMQVIADQYGEDMETLWEMYKGGMSFGQIEKLIRKVYAE